MAKESSNDLTISQFLTEIQVPIKKLTISQLRQREEVWRALWGWTDDEVKHYLTHVGTTIRVLRRDYKGSVGELCQVKFAPKEIEIAVYEKQYNPTDGKYYFERKVMIIPAGAIAWQEFISETQLAEEVDVPEVEGLSALAEIT